MKTLIFNGSPRKDGGTAAAVALLQSRLKGETVVVRAYDPAIHPCVDCRWCWKNPGCRVQDGMQAVYAAIADCDAVVIASPVYFSELTGRMLDVGSRLQPYFCARCFRKERLLEAPKRGGVILVCGGPNSAEKAGDTALELLREMNAADCRPPIAAHNTDELPVAENEAVRAEIFRLADFLNEPA